MTGLLLLGCAKEEVLETPDFGQDNNYQPIEAIGVTIQNNRLHFETNEDFQRFADEITNAHPKAVVEWKQSMNFTSLGDTYFGDATYVTQQPISLDGPVVETDYFIAFNPQPTFMPTDLTNYDVADDTGVESYESGDQTPELQDALTVDPVLSTVINSDGEVGVGNFVVKVSSGYTIITPIDPEPTPDPSPYPKNPIEPIYDPTGPQMYGSVQDRFNKGLTIIENSRIKFSDEFVEVSDHIFVFKHQANTVDTQENGSFWSIFGPNKTGTHQYNSSPRRRTKGRLYSQNYGIYATIGCATYNQRRRWKIWWRSNADNISLTWKNVSYEFKDINGFPYVINEPNGSLSKTNSGKVGKVFAVNTGTFIIPLGGGKFDIKAAKSFKVKTFETTHSSSRSGRTGNVILKY
ncbi:MAG: hypothetical protein WBB45_11075 [Cyclobacteriaceae bacterium]